MHRIYIFFLIVFLSPSSSLSAPEIHVQVNVSKDLGFVPKVFKSSIWIQNLGNSGEAYIIDNFFKDNKPAVVQLTLPIMGISSDFDDLKNRLENYLKTPTAASFLKKVKEYNTLVIVGYDPSPMPEWLTSRPGIKSTDINLLVGANSPPKDYDLWSKIVKYTLQKFKDLGIENLGFYVGHEPNFNWFGTEEELFKYYTSAAVAAKSVSPDILVGGIGTGSIVERKLKCDTYWDPTVKKLCISGGWDRERERAVTENFIRRIGINKVPLDFVNWHWFRPLPIHFLEQTEAIKGWIREAKIDDKGVRLYPADWTYWVGPYPADYLDTQESAAYIIQALYYMWKAGIRWHGHDFDVRAYDNSEEPTRISRKNSTFIGDWSLFTRGGRISGGITKPMYNAFKAVSMVTRENKNGPHKLIEVEFPEKEIVAFSTATSDGKEISLIMSNFIKLNGREPSRYIWSKVQEQISSLLSEEAVQQMKKCIKMASDISKGKKERGTFLQCKDKLISTIKDQKAKEALEFIGKAYVCLNGKNDMDCIIDASRLLKYQESQKIANTIIDILNTHVYPLNNTQRNSKQVQINFTNIPFSGKAKLTAYTIDSTHSNACSLNKRTEPSKTITPCGIGGAVDKAVWEAKEMAKKEGLRVTKDYFLSLGYTDNEIELLEESGKKCIMMKKGIEECIDRLITKNSYQFNYPVRKIKQDSKEAFKRYSKTFNSSYYSSIDKINNWKNISLEGSEKREIVNVIDNTYTLNLNMESNSLWIVVLSGE